MPLKNARQRRAAGGSGDYRSVELRQCTLRHGAAMMRAAAAMVNGAVDDFFNDEMIEASFSTPGAPKFRQGLRL